MKEGFEVPKNRSSLPEGALASETLRILNELQKQRATRRFIEKHPDREVDLDAPGMRNEIMGEWVASGSAAEFANEFGRQDPDQIRQALLEIDAPNVGETEH